MVIHLWIGQHINFLIFIRFLYEKHLIDHAIIFIILIIFFIILNNIFAPVRAHVSLFLFYLFFKDFLKTFLIACKRKKFFLIFFSTFFFHCHESSSSRLCEILFHIFMGFYIVSFFHLSYFHLSFCFDCVPFCRVSTDSSISKHF